MNDRIPERTNCKTFYIGSAQTATAPDTDKVSTSATFMGISHLSESGIPFETRSTKCVNIQPRHTGAGV